MTPFRILWEIHKWIGIVLGAVLMLTALTGVLLLVKKDFDGLQPPTRRGTAAPAEEMQPIHKVYEAVFALGLPQFRSEDDIDRIDFRPGKRVHKVRSKHDYLEVQVDAVSLAVLHPDGAMVRRSDWLEQIHDGQWFADWVHGWFMPAYGLALIVLALTGYLVWLWPKISKARARRRRAAG